MLSIPRRLVLDEPGLSIYRGDEGLRDLGTVLTGVGIVSNLIGGKNSADATKTASQTQVDSTDKAIAEQRRQFDLTRQDNAPFLATGTAANQRLAALLGIKVPQSSTSGGNYQALYDQHYQEDWNKANADHVARYGIPIEASQDPEGVARTKGFIDAQAKSEAQFENNQLQKTEQQQIVTSPDFGSLTRNFTQADINADPVYNSGLQFGLDQGTKAINARAIASGGYDSGATLKALTQFGNDYGSTKANDSFNRFQTQNTNTYNRLAGVSGAGQTAANTVASAGQASTNAISGLMTDAGNARAAGIVGGANAWGSAVTGINNAANNYNSNQTLQALLKRNTSIPTSGGYTPSNFAYTGYGANGDYQYG